MITSKPNERQAPIDNLPNRALWVWNEDDDFLNTHSEQQAIVDLCTARGVNQVFLQVYHKLCAANWTTEHVEEVQNFVKLCRRSGIQVFAMSGDKMWGRFQWWVKKNVVRAVVSYNDVCDSDARFEGFVYDVEPWTDGSLDISDHVAGLCDLIKSTRSALGNLLVGCYSAGFLAIPGHPAAPVFSYGGYDGQGGHHLMSSADFVVVGAYRNYAEGTNGQIEFMQPWYDYLLEDGNGSCHLMCGSETGPITPADDTYYGKTLAYMEAELLKVSNALYSSHRSVFTGHAIHYYNSYRGMS